jgi:choline dehydrogenase-like flavoprotein
MPTSTSAPRTDFTLDVIGRHTCNGFDEAMRSTNQSLRPDARPFDMIIVGGGTFSGVLASKLFNNDRTRKHRILVLDAGPVTLTEHLQNLPMINPTEVWGVPWNSDSPQTWNREFPGLAFTLGGRSLYWGGWSPFFLDSELPSPQWPPSVKDDLTKSNTFNLNQPFLDQAALQIGSATPSDFINQTLHNELMERLFQNLKARSGQPGNVTKLIGHRGADMGDNSSLPAKLKMELEAPLAVESASTRPGMFPFNKFSSTQYMIRSARMAYDESAGDDVRKRLMVVPHTKMIRLELNGPRVAKIHTNQGAIDVPTNGKLFLGLGTIENTRIALNTFPNHPRMGRNLMAHLRTNLTIRVPRSSFGNALDPNLHPELRELAVSALFVKGVHKHTDGTLGHFHVQITASGVGALENNSEAELFKKIPHIEQIEQFKDNTDQWIVITLRGIGEMIGQVGDPQSHDPRNRITTGGASGPFDYEAIRALVSIEASLKDLDLWNAMDAACDELALMFANGTPADLQFLSSQNNGVWQVSPPSKDARRDKLSSTHHEGGTLWMGTNPNTSVTDEWGRIHECDNLYVLGPALLPTLGSPNPMLSGVALARRTADKLVPRPVIPAVENGFTYIFDGTAKMFKNWLTAGSGQFSLIDGCIVAYPDLGGELGLLWFAGHNYDDFTLLLQFRLDGGGDNSGVFVRSRDPRRRVPNRSNPADPNLSLIYNNKAWVAIDTGFEVQIDELARPDGNWMHRTGAIYAIPTGNGANQQAYTLPPLLQTGLQAGTWYEIQIEVVGQVYKTAIRDLNSSQFQKITSYTNKDAYRGKPKAVDPHSGYIGLQAHTGRVAYRNIRIKG